jgi:hypothetical protein
MRLLASALVICTLSMLTACFLGVDETSLVTHVDSNGNRVISDTPEQWLAFKEIMESQIRMELSGEKPPEIHGEEIKSWEDYWLWIISLQRANRENQDKYIQYVLSSRRTGNLPEIGGYDG